MAGSGTAHLRSDTDDVALSVVDISVEFPLREQGQTVRALSGVSFDVLPQETLGVVGESGCGKSTAGRAIVGIWQPDSGRIVFHGEDITHAARSDAARSDIQMVFQDPMASLNPRQSIRESLTEPLEVAWRAEFDRPGAARMGSATWQSMVRLVSGPIVRSATRAGFGLLVLALATQVVLGYDTEDGSVAAPVAVLFFAGAAAIAPAALLLLVGMLVGFAGAVVGAVVEIVESLRRRSDHRAFRESAEERVRSTLEEVGLDPTQTLDKRPHEFSGGQAQRICLARALVRQPSLLICDEPVSALDVSVQAQVLNLLADLTKRHDLSVVLIAHDLAVVKSMSDRIVVMYLGKICEVATPTELFERARHPYTRMLIDAIPIPDPNRSPSTLGRDLGELPSPVNPPSGCRFRTRCDRATELCAQNEPEIVPTGAGSFVACHHPLDAAPAVGDEPERPATAVAAASERADPMREPPDEQPLLQVTGLRTHFSTPRGIVRAVDGVDFRISRGRTLGIVGESGSGKTVLSRSIMNLLPDQGVQRAGTVTLNGSRIDEFDGKQMRSLWGATMAMIFQDPSQSLHPMYTIGRQITDPLRVHLGIDKTEARDRAVELLSSVRIPDAARRLDEYPHQLSGGMRQRAMIAIALSCGPSVMCADEPTTALDVTVQAQVLDLLHVQQQDRMMAMILVTHDLGVVAGRADEVAVMYAGRIVEHAAVRELFEHPMHPYTHALLKSIPRLDDAAGVRRQAIDGRPPELIDREPGCSFAPRCTSATAQCLHDDPELVEIAPGHSVACHHPIHSLDDMDHVNLAHSSLDGNRAERSKNV